MELSSLEDSRYKGDGYSRLSFMNSDAEIHNDSRKDSVTGDSLKQIMSLTEQLHSLEDENDFLTEENVQMKEKVRLLEATLKDRTDEVDELKEYVDELISQLTATRADVATFRSETDRFKVERLARDSHGDQLDFKEDTDTASPPVAPKREKQGANNYKPSQIGIKTSTLPNSPFSQTTPGNQGSPAAQIQSPERLASDFELRQIKRQLASLLKQMENNDINMTKLEKENLELKKRLKAVDRAKDVDTADSRSKVELLHVIRCSIEEKVKWQTYAERLIKRILLQSPGILDVTENSQIDLSDLSAEIRSEGRWEGFAYSLVQRVMECAPHLLDNMNIPDRSTKIQHEEKVNFV